DNVSLIEPVDYLAMVHFMQRADLILTDSGGLQEEAPSFGVPVVLMRETTERPEGVAAGFVRIAGTTRASIVRSVREVLDNKSEPRHRGAAAQNPYGDGRAAQRIVDALLDELTPGSRVRGAPWPATGSSPVRADAGSGA